eukprot:1156170-Pelagomonas_calceolata.AAC.7
MFLGPKKGWIVKLAPNDQHSWTPAVLRLPNHAAMPDFAGGHWGNVLADWEQRANATQVPMRGSISPNWKPLTEGQLDLTGTGECEPKTEVLITTVECHLIRFPRGKEVKLSARMELEGCIKT